MAQLTYRDAVAAGMAQEMRRDPSVVFSKRDDLPRLGGQTTFPTVTEISLTSFDPGDYILTLEAKSSLSPNRPISRQIPFSVTNEP